MLYVLMYRIIVGSIKEGLRLLVLDVDIFYFLLNYYGVWDFIGVKMYDLIIVRVVFMVY